MSLRDEILEQPEVAARLVAGQASRVEEIATKLSGADRPRIRSAMIAARGSSDHAAIYAQYLLGAFHRLPVALAAPSLVTVYDSPPRLREALVIGISQSGRSPDVVGVVQAAHDDGAATVAITNDPGSPLARAAEHVIEVQAGPERSVAATKTYTAQLLAVAMLASALESTEVDDQAEAGPLPFGGRATRLAALADLPQFLGMALTAEGEAAAIARSWHGLDRSIVLGRGFEYATAREWALKLKELAQVSADPYSAADFQHGPLALVEPGYPVLAVATSGRPLVELERLLERLRRELDVDLLVLSDVARLRDSATAAITVPSGVPEWLLPVVSIVPAQLFALHLTRAKGLDPDAPRWISKVTLTR